MLSSSVLRSSSSLSSVRSLLTAASAASKPRHDVEGRLVILPGFGYWHFPDIVPGFDELLFQRSSPTQPAERARVDPQRHRWVNLILYFLQYFPCYFPSYDGIISKISRLLFIVITVKRFSHDVIKPLVRSMDDSSTMHESVLKGTFANGFMGIEVPEKYQGEQTMKFLLRMFLWEFFSS